MRMYADRFSLFSGILLKMYHADYYLFGRNVRRIICSEEGTEAIPKRILPFAKYFHSKCILLNLSYLDG